jgi:hypothetical protein
MHGTYLQNKKSYQTYVKKNPEKIRALNNKAVKRHYQWKKIQKEFFNIIIIF